MKKTKRKTNKRKQQDGQTIALKPKLLTLAIAQALALQAAQAGTIEVTSNLDDGTGCTLREAIMASDTDSIIIGGGCSSSGSLGGNDEIVFAPSVSGSTITLTGGQLVIIQNVSINVGGSETTIAGNGGSRIMFAPFATVSLDHLILTGGNATSGGAIRGGKGATLLLNNSTITGNTVSSAGGGIAADNSSVSLINTTVSDNSASQSGGGLFAYSGTVTLTNSTVSGNSSNFGGGISVSSYYDANVILMNSTVSDNSANSSGGGIRVFSSGFFDGDVSVTLTNSTVSGNSASAQGGGIYASGYRSADVTLMNSTVSGNSAVVSDGGGIHVYSYYDAQVSLANSILTNSVDGDDCYVGGSNTVMAQANADSVITDGSCGTSAQAIDPGLMLLANNGGPTETHALMPGSPAIDGGNNATCEATDQRGETRNDGACDIGAYEFKATVMPIAKKDRKMGNLMSGGDQWYSFNSTESQKLSMQTNGYDGDTLMDFYSGNNPKSASPLANDDDSGPDLFSNIKHNVTSGPHLIRVKGKTDVDPYWLRLMSDKDILSFNDTNTHFANKEIRVMSSAGITGGCGVNKYCPTDPVTRAQMAIFMLKAILGGNHNSPAATGSVFSDVSTSSFGASFIEEFSTLGITSGCGGGKYCPDLAVTREQMAVFLLRAWYGSSYMPPAATPAEINQFSDIANSFARDWIVQLTKENITGGCGGGKFCPTDTVTRGQMAAFIARTFSLDTEL